MTDSNVSASIKYAVWKPKVAFTHIQALFHTTDCELTWPVVIAKVFESSIEVLNVVRKDVVHSS
jgi:hypothetical protein